MDAVILLDEQLFYLISKVDDLRLEFTALICGHGASNHRSTHSTRPPQGNLARNKDVWDILVLTQQWQMQQDLQRLCICRHDDELGDSSVEGLCGFISTLA